MQQSDALGAARKASSAFPIHHSLFIILLVTRPAAAGQPSAFTPSYVSNPLVPPPTAFCIWRAAGPEGPPFLLTGTTLAGAGAILKFQILNRFTLSAHCLVTPALCSAPCQSSTDTWHPKPGPGPSSPPTTYDLPPTRLHLKPDTSTCLPLAIWPKTCYKINSACP